MSAHVWEWHSAADRSIASCPFCRRSTEFPRMMNLLAHLFRRLRCR